MLAKLRPYADLVTPGLELSSLEYPSHEPIFVESMEEEFSLPRLPPPSSRRTTRSASRTNSPVKTPDPVKRRSPTKRRASATPEVKSSGFNLRPKAGVPRLRHDDSQIQFAAVDSSPQLNLIHEEMESQLLTERQKEVRERQKENAALFPELRSSPATRTRSSARLAARSREGSPTVAQTPQAGTPRNPGGRFTEFVSGTPTPRRGQALTAIVDQDMDMMDPPSSPPIMEPRRNPLAAEIRSRSANTSLLDDWQLSSSPISGSPLRQQSFAPVPSSLAVALDAVNAAVESSLAPEEAAEQDLMDGDDDIIEESVLPDQENQALPTMEPAKGGHLGVPRQETPEKSDHELEEFVDAPSSPLPPTPHKVGKSSAKPIIQANTDPVKKAAPAPAPTPAFATAPTIAPAVTTAVPAPTPSGAPSYDGGEWDDRSLLKLVVELDSGKLDRQEYTRPSPSVSPEKLALTAANLKPSISSNKPGSGPTSGAPSPAASCIVALDDDNMVEEESENVQVPKPVAPRGRVTRSRASSVASNRSVEQIPSSQAQQEQATTQEKGKSKLKGPTSARATAGKGKRKRVASAALETAAAAAATAPGSGKKRRVGRPSSTAPVEREAEVQVPGSQSQEGKSFLVSSLGTPHANGHVTAVPHKTEPIFYDRLPISVASSSQSPSLSQPPSSRASSVVSNSVLNERARGFVPGGSGTQRTVPSSLLPQQTSQLSTPASVPRDAGDAAEQQSRGAQQGRVSEMEEVSSDGDDLVQSQIEIESRSADERQSLSMSQVEHGLKHFLEEDEDLIPSSPFMAVPASGRSASGSEVLVEDTVLSQQQQEDERMDVDVEDDDDDQPLASTQQQQQQQRRRKKPEVGNNHTNTGLQEEEVEEDMIQQKRVRERLTEDIITSALPPPPPPPPPGGNHPDENLQRQQQQQLPQQQQNQPGEEPVQRLEASLANNSSSSKESSSKERILSSLRVSLNELRTATAAGGLSRQEVYEIEDLFMDLKRELYEAERKGRS